MLNSVIEVGHPWESEVGTSPEQGVSWASRFWQIHYVPCQGGEELQRGRKLFLLDCLHRHEARQGEFFASLGLFLFDRIKKPI